MTLFNFWHHDTKGFEDRGKLSLDWYTCSEHITKWDKLTKPRWNYFHISIVAFGHVFNFDIRLNKTSYTNYENYRAQRKQRIKEKYEQSKND